MLNVVVLIGRLTQDPAMQYVGDGIALCRFTLAVDRPGAEKATDFIDIVVWRKLAEVCANHLSKGSPVAVRGRIQVRSYEGKDGQRRRAVEVVAEDVRFLPRPRPQEGPVAGGDDLDDLNGLPGPDVPF